MVFALKMMEKFSNFKRSMFEMTYLTTLRVNRIDHEEIVSSRCVAYMRAHVWEFSFLDILVKWFASCVCLYVIHFTHIHARSYIRAFLL